MTRVIVVGGGYGGITVAKALDDVAEVVLVEPRDAFVHNVAALRAVVDPAWADRIFIPYDRLLGNGRVRRARADRVTADGRVELSGGETLEGDYVVLATGSSYPFPAKIGIGERERIEETHRALEKAEHVLLVGAETGYADLPARRPDGRIAVGPDLRVCGTETLFAIGDITALPELKMARLAQMQSGPVPGATGPAVRRGRSRRP